jgi:hypothetical protein
VEINPLCVQEEDIINWMENTIADDTEDIFNFLTEEKEKFLQRQRVITNQNDTNSLHSNTPSDNPNDLELEITASNHTPQPLPTLTNTVQSTSRDQETISEANSENNYHIHKKTQSPNARIIIASHNIRGITRITDQELVLEEIKQRNIGIMGLCETKLTENNQNFAFKNSEHYQSFSSAGQSKPYGSGVLLLVRKDIGKYIESVERIPGYMIAVNLLSRRRKTFICQIYLPCQKKESNLVQEEIRKTLNKKKKDKFAIIIMGDFNAVVNPRRDRSRND